MRDGAGWSRHALRPNPSSDTPYARGSGQASRIGARQAGSPVLSYRSNYLFPATADTSTLSRQAGESSRRTPTGCSPAWAEHRAWLHNVAPFDGRSLSASSQDNVAGRAASGTSHRATTGRFQNPNVPVRQHPCSFCRPRVTGEPRLARLTIEARQSPVGFFEISTSSSFSTVSSTPRHRRCLIESKRNGGLCLATTLATAARG